MNGVEPDFFCTLDAQVAPLPAYALPSTDLA